MIACLNHAFPGIEDSGSKSASRFYPFSFWDIVQLAKTTHHQLIPNVYHKSEKGKFIAHGLLFCGFYDICISVN